jgi:hypothetical protein
VEAQVKTLGKDQKTWSIVSLGVMMAALPEEHHDPVIGALDRSLWVSCADINLVTPNRLLNLLTHEIPEDIMSELRIALSGADYIEL